MDFGWVIQYKFPLLKKAAENFRVRASPARREDYEDFCRQNASWLDNYALFMALKEAHGGEAVWNKWERDIATRQPDALARWQEAPGCRNRGSEIRAVPVFQQWSELKAYCHERGIQMMGDIPIFVAHDSADVWAHPELFHLDPDGNPSVQAGVPPDYFSATGQLWGNPLYRWNVMAETGYSWWIERFRSALRLVDIIRLDHFRGFEAYWEIPAGEKTAINGRWVKGPGAELFEAVQKALGDLPIVAETLGVITPEVIGASRPVRFSGNGDFAVCLWQRSPSAGIQAPQLTAATLWFIPGRTTTIRPSAGGPRRAPATARGQRRTSGQKESSRASIWERTAGK